MEAAKARLETKIKPRFIGLCKEVLYDIDMTLGKRIKSERLRAKMTQDDLAGFLGITYQAVSQWERDETRPDQDRLAHLARLLERSTDYLLTGRERNNAA